MPRKPPKPSSRQEEVCQTFIRNCGSACWCFIPDKYGSPGREYEAADFVWRNGSSIAFFYMTSSKKKSLGQCNRHNFEQAQRWLDHWRNGETLVGRNRFQEFTLRAGDFRHLAVFSVVKCRGGKVEYHGGRAKDLGVTLAATLTETHLLELAQTGCTVSDLLFFINQVRLGYHRWPAGYTTRTTKEMLAQQTRPANDALRIHPYNFERALALLRNVRVPSENVLRTESQMKDALLGSFLISDLNLPEILHCARAIAPVVQEAAPPPFGRGLESVITEHQGKRFSPRAHAVTAATLAAALAMLGAPAVGGTRPTDFFVFDGVYRVDADPIFARYTSTIGEGAGNAEALLDEIAAAEQFRVRPRDSNWEIPLRVRVDDIGNPP